MEVDRSVKRLHRLFVVGFSVKLKDFDDQFWNIFEVKLKADRLLNFEKFLVGVFELKDNLFLNPSEFIWTKVISQINKTFVCEVHLDLLFDFLDVHLFKVSFIILKRSVFLLANVLKILRDHIILRPRVIKPQSCVALHILKAVSPFAIYFLTLEVPLTDFFLLEGIIDLEGIFEILLKQVLIVLVELDGESQHLVQQILNQRFWQFSCGGILIQLLEVRELLLVVEKLLVIS